ncbi:MAG: YHS domain-containing (seleno)protein [Vicinamibacterales bacterium]
MRTGLLIVGVLLGVAAGGWAQGPPAAPVNVDADGVTLHGYDAVAYFTDGKAVPGSPAHEYVWQGARWRFASAAHKDAFAAAPERYAPQFGGYCAWAVSRNYVADIDPMAFAVVDGKLYVNYSLLVQARWRLDRDANIAKGARNWPGLLEQAKAMSTGQGAAAGTPAGKKGGR